MLAKVFIFISLHTFRSLSNNAFDHYGNIVCAMYLIQAIEWQTIGSFLVFYFFYYSNMSSFPLLFSIGMLMIDPTFGRTKSSTKLALVAIVQLTKSIMLIN